MLYFASLQPHLRKIKNNDMHTPTLIFYNVYVIKQKCVRITLPPTHRPPPPCLYNNTEE